MITTAIRGLAIGLAFLLGLIIIAAIHRHTAGSPGPAIPHPVHTNDPLWIIHHCNIPSVRKAHDLLCP